MHVIILCVVGLLLGETRCIVLREERKLCMRAQEASTGG
jgi:hypothetical protein